MKNKKFYFSSLMLIAFLFFNNAPAFVQAADEETVIKVKPAVVAVYVNGDREKFEEDKWTSRNGSGGIEDLTITKKLSDQDSLDYEGKAIYGNHDYKSILTLSREGVGSLTAAFKNFRKYYDGTGGYYRYPGTSNWPVGELDNDLNMDIGSFKLEGILAKENSPEYNLSFERAYRNGSKSLLRWMTVTTTGAAENSRKINPTYLDTAETIDRLKAGVKHETDDTLISGEQLWEHTRVKNKDIYSQTYTINTNTLGAPSIQYWNMDSDLNSSILRYAKDLNDKTSVACGLLFNTYRGGSLENLQTSTGRDNFASIEQNNLTLLPNISFTPMKDLLIGASSKAEFINKNGASSYNTATRNINIKSELYNKIFTQGLELKYSGMKNIVWFADGEYEKRIISQFEEQNSFSTGSTSENFLRDTNSLTNLTNFTVGCKWYPISKLSFTVQAKSKNQFTDNKHDKLTGDITTAGGTSPGTYRAFIDSMSTYTRSPSVKMKYKPYRWLTTNLGYIFDSTEYGVRTRASDQTMKSKYYAHTYNTEVTITPYEYLYCSLFYERRNSSTRTAADQLKVSEVNIPIYNSDVDVYRLSYGYALTKNTSLDGGYSMYETNNFNDVYLNLPLGLDNMSQDIFLGCRHAFDKDRSMELKYTYTMYNENSNENVDDYEGHMLYASMNFAF